MELILVLSLAVFFLWRQRKLRQQLLRLTDLSIQQNDALHRELLELKRQVAASSQAVSSATNTHLDAPSSAAARMAPPPVEKPATPVAPVVKKPAEPPTVSPFPVSVGIVTEIASEKHAKDALTPVSAPPVSARPGELLEAKPPVAASEREHKPLPPLPVAAEPTIAKPAAPTAVPIQTPETTRPPAPQTPTPPHNETPRTPPPPPVAAPSAAARVVAPPQFATLRSTAPRPTAQQRMKSVFALEETLGTNWLNKLGIIILVFGVALFGIYELGQLGPIGKVACLS